MLRHINCIRGEENYASGGVIAEEEKALELKCTHEHTHSGLGPSPAEPNWEAGPLQPSSGWEKGAHFPFKSALDVGERDLLH